jgi:hypothetical protein
MSPLRQTAHGRKVDSGDYIFVYTIPVDRTARRPPIPPETDLAGRTNDQQAVGGEERTLPDRLPVVPARAGSAPFEARCEFALQVRCMIRSVKGERCHISWECVLNTIPPDKYLVL